ncbi:hypothetical protein IQ276_019615 [Desmonostoc muscorum LEGE 12446]|uniref:Uncharacterized protein n=1 Tax=Desmonostoc muscorum LEGE 12446 TaxID=1828758 RepID=A0A8J6ZTW2_DESMC|nr:hypothetical protein [Desmonostoc muscorum]MCF2148596.1 hypothetical protein [Desmonostoc muscorum LEGE 12446]
MKNQSFLNPGEDVICDQITRFRTTTYLINRGSRYSQMIKQRYMLKKRTIIYKKNSELRSQKTGMNSVRVGDEYWLKASGMVGEKN